MDGGDGGKKSGGDLETTLVVRLADVVRKNATENVEVEGERRAKVVVQCERALRASVSETRTMEKKMPDVAHRVQTKVTARRGALLEEMQALEREFRAERLVVELEKQGI